MLYFSTLSLVIVTTSKKLIKFVRHDLLLVNAGWLLNNLYLPAVLQYCPWAVAADFCTSRENVKLLKKWGWREGRIFWEWKAGSDWSWGVHRGARGILAIPQVGTEECKSHKSLWMLQQHCSLALNGKSRAGKEAAGRVWCSRAGLCHRALEGGGGAQGFLQCCSAKPEPTSRDLRDQGRQRAAAVQGWVAEQCRLQCCSVGESGENELEKKRVSGTAAVQRSCAETGEGMQGASCNDAVQSKEEGKLGCRS